MENEKEINQTMLRRIVVWMCRKAINTRTIRGKQWIGRNDPCYCGSEKKFKKCCWVKHAVLRGGTMTPEMVKFVKKQDAYFAKRSRNAV